MKTIIFALNLLRRDYKSGELRILLTALIIAVAAMTSIGFYTDRVMRSMEIQATELLAADRVISSYQALPKQWQQQAKSFGLNTAEVLGFSSMLSKDDQFYLVDIRAVSEHYPLRGEIRIKPSLTLEETRVDHVPPEGELWVEARLLDLLKAKLDDKVQIGDAQFKLSAILTHEPNLNSNWFKVAPYVLMNQKDIEKTKVVQPGSRINYRLLVSEPAVSRTDIRLNQFQSAIETQLQSGQEFLTIREARPVLKNALERAEQFLNLSMLISVILAGIAIAMASRRYSFRHYDVCAIMRCVGAQQRQILIIYMTHLVFLGLIGALIGSLLGLIGQQIFDQLFSGVLNIEMPSIRWQAALPGIFMGLIILIGFGLPPLLQLKNVPPLRVLRKDIIPSTSSSWLLYLSAASSIILLLLWQTADISLTFYVFIGAGFSIAILLSITYLMIRMLSSVRQKVGVSWQYGFANLSRHSLSNMVQILAFGLAILVVLLLSFVRTDLLSSWSNQLPENTPNYFLINIQPYQVSEVNQFFKDNQVENVGLYPMIRGRLVELNDQPIMEVLDEQARETRALHRELNISYVADLPEANEIVAGQWWQSPLASDALIPISIEKDLAERLTVKLGDKLGFSIGSQSVTGVITNLRNLRWDSFQPNFFILFPPNVLEQFPTTYLTSFYLPENKKTFTNQLLHEYPTINVLDVDAILTQVRNILAKVSSAIEFIFFFTLLAGMVVLFAAVNSTLDRRLYEGAILRTMGASKRTIQASLLAEFISIGFLAGLFAAIGASIISVVLANKVFNLPAIWHFELWLIGPMIGMLLVGISGYIATRQVVKQAPMLVLRRL